MVCQVFVAEKQKQFNHLFKFELTGFGIGLTKASRKFERHSEGVRNFRKFDEATINQYLIVSECKRKREQSSIFRGLVNTREGYSRAGKDLAI